MATQVISPLKTKSPILETHVPRMTLKMDEFSAAWSALEDDYSLLEPEDESIPANIQARELVAGEQDYFSVLEKTQNISKTISLELPALSLSSQDIQVATADNAKVKTEGTSAFAAKNSLLEQATYRFPHYWLHGKIELTGGLAITGPKDQVQIGWFRTDEPERKGIVSLENGTYELKVDRMEGEVIAQLIDGRGDVLGEAVLDLETLAQERSLQQMIIENVDIKIKPYDFSVGKTISTYDTKNNKDVVAHATVRVGQHDLTMESDEKGQLSAPAVSPQSIAVVSTSKAQYRDSLALVHFGARPDLRMFPEKYLSAMFKILKLPEQQREMGLIWGVVSHGGNPVNEHRVRLAKIDGFDPIYFNFYIPDRSLKATSTDGQFVFVGLPDADYELELLDSKGQVVDAKVVAVRSGFVSQAEFEIRETKMIHLRPFDPLSTTKVDVELAILGLETTYSGQSEKFIPVPVRVQKDPLVVFSKSPQNTISSSSLASRQKKFQDIPILNEKWWERLRADHQIDVKQGVVIGFIDSDQAFEVFVEDSAPNDKIMYFNSRGEIVDKSKGEMASGFILYNAGFGLKTLIFQSEAGLLHTEVAYVDGESVALIYKLL